MLWLPCRYSIFTIFETDLIKFSQFRSYTNQFRSTEATSAEIRGLRMLILTPLLTTPSSQFQHSLRDRAPPLRRRALVSKRSAASPKETLAATGLACVVWCVNVAQSDTQSHILTELPVPGQGNAGGRLGFKICIV